MKSFLPIFLLALLSVNFLFSGCSQEEEFAKNPLESLSFSADTLSFDTVLTTVGSPTVCMTIRNNGTKPIRLSGVSLKSGGASGFRINLDGISDKSYTNVDIPANDSLFLFVELTAAEQGTNKPFMLSDAIVFQSEGKQKQIVLEAFSQDVIKWRGLTIHSDTTLTADKPYLIYDSLVVSKDVTLTIQEGATFYMHNKAKMVVHGSVKAIGSMVAPITFRGDRLDEIWTDLPYELNPGQWGSIHLTSTSFNNEFNFVHIRGGVSGVVADSSSTDWMKLKMTNSIVHNMTEYGIWSCNNKMSISNSQISNSVLSTISLNGGTYDFTHCTIANYQMLPLNGNGRNGFTLSISNYKQDVIKTPFPLQADFYNCIVFGSFSNEIDTLKTNQASWKLQFKNCLLRSKEFTSDMASGCIYSQKPQFVKTGMFLNKVSGEQERDFIYDFRLDSISDARSAADPIYSGNYPFDLNGISRLSDGLPDMGAYEWHSK